MREDSSIICKAYRYTPYITFIYKCNPIYTHRFYENHHLHLKEAKRTENAQRESMLVSKSIIVKFICVLAIFHNIRILFFHNIYLVFINLHNQFKLILLNSQFLHPQPHN